MSGPAPAGRLAARRSVLALWVAALPLLAVSLYRPPATGGDRARRLPARLAGFELEIEHALTARHRELLGTDDVVWRTYRDADGGPPVFVVLVHHEQNWKSVHPPRICLEGSNMEVLDESTARVRIGGAPLEAGEITTSSRDRGREYFGLYLYVAPDLRTANYGSFVMHHAPRALLRRSLRGCLVRVETWIADGEDRAAARDRCARLLDGVVRAAEEAFE